MAAPGAGTGLSQIAKATTAEQIQGQWRMGQWRVKPKAPKPDVRRRATPSSAARWPVELWQMARWSVAVGQWCVDQVCADQTRASLSATHPALMASAPIETGGQATPVIPPLCQPCRSESQSPRSGPHPISGLPCLASHIWPPASGLACLASIPAVPYLAHSRGPLPPAPEPVPRQSRPARAAPAEPPRLIPASGLPVSNGPTGEPLRGLRGSARKSRSFSPRPPEAQEAGLHRRAEARQPKPPAPCQRAARQRGQPGGMPPHLPPSAAPLRRIA